MPGASACTDNVAADAQLISVALNREAEDMNGIAERVELRRYESSSADCEGVELWTGAFEVRGDADLDVEQVSCWRARCCCNLLQSDQAMSCCHRSA